MVYFVEEGKRAGKVHNDPTSGSPSRRVRKEGKKSLIVKGKRKPKR
jgi:hypothetical protein